MGNSIGRALTVATWCLLAQTGVAIAQPYELAPLTRLRLTVMQFIPSTGDYRRWDALGGELVVGSDGTVVVPVLGSIPAGGYSPDDLGVRIAAMLQEKLGLVDLPETTVQVVDYPPIYLVGNVATPGQYPFRPGMTVLQAVAIGGGEFRAATSEFSPTEIVKLQAELQGIADEILRSTARQDRLRAELANAEEITFSAMLAEADPTSVEIVRGEQTIFDARRNEVNRQAAALNELGELLRTEINFLGQKVEAIDEQDSQTAEQLKRVEELVQKGMATVSRKTDVERLLADLRSDRLDNLIATMRAHESLNESMRNLARLEDDRRSEVSGQLQVEQASYERLLLNQATATRLLRHLADIAADDEDDAQTSLSYFIVRSAEGATIELAATETTPLMPGDLLKVTLTVDPTGVGVEVTAAASQ